VQPLAKEGITMATVQGSPPPAPHPRAWKFIQRKPLTASRAARIIALATVM
jgi:hypothetical protein